MKDMGWLVPVIIIVASIIQSVTRKREETDEQQGKPRKPRRGLLDELPPGEMDWQEQLRRMLEGRTAPEPPKQSPPAPAPLPKPEVYREAPATRGPQPFMTRPVVIDSENDLETATFTDQLVESQSSYQRASTLQEQVGRRMARVGEQTGHTHSETPLPRSQVGPNWGKAAGLLRTRENLRATILASVILGRPRCEELLVALLFLAPLMGCTNSTSPAPQSVKAPPPQSTEAKTNSIRTFAVKGVVKEVRAAQSEVVIKHETITNYMEAMTMPFSVKNTNELAGLASGDQVTFKMIVTPDEGWIEQIRKTGAAAPETNAPPQHQSVRVVREVEPLAVGDKMPDYSFTNAIGKKVSLSDFKGQALAFTFMFTRCPFPNFCPRMSSNFAEAAKKLSSDPAAPKNWHLLTISFDPEFDTPERLRTYSEGYNKWPEKWDFATGAMIDIDAITEQFGLSFVYRDGTYDHKLRTVLVDAKGVIQQIYIGNEWKVDDFVEEMHKAAKVI